MENPLLSNTTLPPFSQIKPEHIEPAIDTILSDNLKQLEKLLAQPSYAWQNLMQPLEDMKDRLNRAWSAVGHMNAVVNSPALRDAYNACLPKLSEYATQLSQNEKLFNAVKQISESAEYQTFSIAQKKVLEHALRDFRLAGVHLPADKKQRFAELDKAHTQLTAKFEQNLLDATQGWTRLVTDEKELAGIPSHAIALAKQLADKQNLNGWLFTLEMPSYHAVLTYADSAALRQELYYAYVTRASDQGPNAGKWDNSEVMQQILQTRLEMAKLLGFNNFAEYSLATKMAKTPTEVLNFLHELVRASIPHAKTEFNELKQFANSQFGISELNPWDIAYYSEKLRQHQYAISEEDLRPYFPEDQVLSGLFNIVQRLYGLQIQEIKGIDTWREEVRFFEIRDAENQIRGQFYLDLYARQNKRGGAWMDECRVRRKLAAGDIQIPVTYLTCNFNAPINGESALFTHDEVQTLFHEFGHGLQHMLTKIDHSDVSGINGVPWDAVEIASQFMENWCWQRESIHLTAKHYKTHEPLPDDLFEKMLRAKNFQSAMQMIRQLEFALFDFRLHTEFDPEQKDQIQKILNEVRQEVTVVPVVAFNRFQHSFSHIFAGGYAAGYYSYKWAEVLACDAFSKFEETGIFNQQTGKEFLTTLLETGGAEEPMDLFIKFRGRPPKIDALLRHSGITQ